MARRPSPRRLGSIYSTSIFLGNGDGTYKPELNFQGQFYEGFSVSEGDFNNDGHIDLTIGQYGGELPEGYYSSVGVYLQTSVQALPGSVQLPIASIGTTTPPQNVTVTNQGESELEIKAVKITGENASDFGQTNTCIGKLGVGSECTIMVVSSPTLPYSENASLVIADNAAVSPQSVPLNAIGSYYALTPQTVNFGGVSVGQSSAPQTVTLANVGPAGVTLDVAGILFQGPDALQFTRGDNCPSKLSSGQSCQITITFSPTKKGKIRAKLAFGYTALTVR